MIVICAWHQWYFPNEQPPEKITGNPDDGLVSHGMCERCAVIFKQQAK